MLQDLQWDGCRKETDYYENPYMVRVGNMKIKVRFANNGISFNQAFENLLLNI